MRKYTEFINSFVSYCEEQNISTASAKSYVSYLNGAVKHISWPLVSFKQKVEKDSTATLMSDFEYLLIKTDEQRRAAGASGKPSKKTFSNYRSAIIVFLGYLQQTLEEGRKKTAKKRTVPAGKKLSLSHDDLFQTFKSRILTQGRVYSDFVIPFRTYNRILRKLPRYTSALRTYIESVCFIAADLGSTDFTAHEEVPLGQVREIEFRPHATHLFLKNAEEKVVLTQVFDKSARGAYYEPYTGLIGDLSLDHQTPLVSLKGLIASYPEMQKISDGALAYQKAHPHTPKSFLDREYSQCDFADVDGDKLCTELFDFLANTKLLTMDRSYNSSKNGEV